LAEADFGVQFRIDLMRLVYPGPDTVFDRTVYEGTTTASLDASASLVVSYPELDLDFGLYTVTCWTELDNDSDRSNDTAYAMFVVTSEPGGRADAIRIYTRAGEFIRELAIPADDYQPWVDWDGNNHDGQPVAKGKYLCLLVEGQEVLTSYNALVPEPGQAVRLSTTKD
jgi:hypothetical protein